KRRGMRRVDVLTLGGTRLGGRAERVILAQSLRTIGATVSVLPDFEIAHRAAFGTGPGIILVASTGSIAFARGRNGRTRRAGGLGHWFGDEGSGYWLGRMAVLDEPLRKTLRLPHPLDLAHVDDPVRATAALAPRVLRSRCARARHLRARAAIHLAALVTEAARGLSLPRPVPLALHGSLFKDAGLTTEMLRRLRRVSVVAPRVSAERAAAGL
ncbi:MAG: hypothetical protein HYZ74_00060, partial [Elusimicrobia bacterium]|nr:hypothetical protein [Elusimicrobiota bacterium]